jgi:hypothetical protein
MHLHAIQLAAGNPHGGHDLLFGELPLMLPPGFTGAHHHQDGSGNGHPTRRAVQARTHAAIESVSGFLPRERLCEFLFQPIH